MLITVQIYIDPLDICLYRRYHHFYRSLAALGRWRHLSHFTTPEFSFFTLHPPHLQTTLDPFAGIDLSSSLLFRRLAVFTCPETPRNPHPRNTPEKPISLHLCSTPRYYTGTVVRCSLRGYFGLIGSLCDPCFFLEESILPCVLEKHSISLLLVDSF